MVVGEVGEVELAIPYEVTTIAMNKEACPPNTVSVLSPFSKASV